MVVSKIPLLLTFFVLTNSTKTSAESGKPPNTEQFSYESQDEWPPLCRNGNLQSPINIDPNEVSRNFESEFTFVDYGQHQQAEMVLNGEHLQLILVNNSEPLFPKINLTVGNRETYTYKLMKIGWHWSSINDGCEHRVDDICPQLEAHLEHELIGDGLIVNVKDTHFEVRFINVVIQYMADSHAQRLVDEKVVNAVQRLTNQAGPLRKLNLEFTPSQMVRPSGYGYMYYGSKSFPAPDCTENVLWLLQPQILNIRMTELYSFRKLSTSQNWTTNARNPSVQKSAQGNSGATDDVRKVFAAAYRSKVTTFEKEEDAVHILRRVLFSGAKYLFIVALAVLFSHYISY